MFRSCSSRCHVRSVVQSFLAGFVGPALFVVPFCAVLSLQGNIHVITAYPFCMVPLVWALWNVLYYLVARHVLILKKIGVWGGILGVGLALIGAHYYHTLELYSRYFSLQVELYQVLIIDGVVYVLLWESVMRYLNRILID